MRKTIIATALAAGLLACGAAQAQTLAQTQSTDAATARPPVSDCLWSALPAEARAEVQAAYDKGMPAATAALGRHDAQIKAAASTCVGRDGAPALWIEFAASSAMIRDVSLGKIAEKLASVTASSLRAAWNEADPAARACARVNAARVYGPNAEALLKGQTCPRYKAVFGLLEAAGIDPSDNQAAFQAMIHFNAVASGEFADGLLAMYRDKGPAKGS